MISRLFYAWGEILNIILFALSYSLRTTKALCHPLVVNLEPTNYCNLRCQMCPVSQKSHDSQVERGFLSRQTFSKLLPQLATIKPLIALNMGGESLLHPDLHIFVRELKRSGCKTMLDTNATLLAPQRAEQLISAEIDEITLCLDGNGGKESYEEIRAGAEFESVVANIKGVLAARNKLGNSKTRVTVKNIQYYQGSQLPDTPVALKELFSEAKPDAYACTTMDYWPGDHFALLRTPYNVEPFDDSHLVPCPNLWKKLAIGWDGKAYICCLDINRTTVIGDLTQQSLDEVWNGPELRRFRELHRNGMQHTIPLCSTCTMIRRKPHTMLQGLFSKREERQTRFRSQ